MQRDLDSPDDQVIGLGTSLEFADGPVLITRCKEDDQPTEFTIIVNTRNKTVSQSSLNFDEVVRLAFENPPTGPNVRFLVTYRRGPACNPKGSLVKGGKAVQIQNGMIFDVTPTDKS